MATIIKGKTSRRFCYRQLVCNFCDDLYFIRINTVDNEAVYMVDMVDTVDMVDSQDSKDID